MALPLLPLVALVLTPFAFGEAYKNGVKDAAPNVLSGSNADSLERKLDLTLLLGGAVIVGVVGYSIVRKTRR